MFPIMSSFVQFIILIILVLANSTTFVSSFTNITDQQALLSIKASITADPLGVLATWNSSVHFCHWTGVTCSRRRQRVTALNISNHQLAGTLSPHIGNLSFLRVIDLKQNYLHGSIPSETGLLFRLQHLDLDDNHFEAGFPVNLSNCADIRYISLYDNNLTGKLPDEFAYWPKIAVFDLGMNHLTGSIPPAIGNTSSLRYLGLGFNNLIGGIPSQIAHHTILRTLSLGINSLSGTVPASLYNISSLTAIELTKNMFEGTLPSDFSLTLPKLRGFHVAENKFSGQLPPSIANASNLAFFDIQQNSISGPIPNNLGSLPNLQSLLLGHNPLGVNMRPNDWSFLNSLINCTNLKTLSLNENDLRGELPNTIGNLSATMEKLYLYKNHLYGSIPREIGKLQNLILLSLYGNLLTGTIPDSVGELSKLIGLGLFDNRISGVIPRTIGNMTQLVRLYLDDNRLRGSIPAQLFNISTLEGLSLPNNRLSGVIPEEIVFASQCAYIYLSQNLFDGQLPSNIGSLKHLVKLHVSRNKLTGDVPTSLGGCVMLEELNMEGNHFHGRIPPSFEALKSLRILDLSSNNISENIPSFFEDFHLIEFLNLSHNKFGGEVPRGGLFSNVSAFSVVGNVELCGGIRALDLPACPPVKVSRNKKKSFGLRTTLFLVLVPLVFLLACLALICYQRRNSRRLNDPVPVLKDNQYPKLSYKDLVQATNEFSPDNLLGKGRYSAVYKGILDSVEHVLAVKVLNVEVRGANKSFLAECETLRNTRHRNLIKIITACSSTDSKGNDFKALVFEFMINGSVDSWLHPSPSDQGNEKNLTLLQRLNISIDVALGVDYLHHHSHASIIHSDIKPSNILLDEDFVAHISDFGLTRFSFATTSDNNQTRKSSTSVRGTVGYVPPEYGMFGEISTEGDVYSYGILVLEIFTGKRPTDGSILRDGCNNLHEYVRKALPYRVREIVDPRISLDEKEHGTTANQSHSSAIMEECLISIFEVGLLCSEEMPQKRIDISVAIKQLNVARDKLLKHMS